MITEENLTGACRAAALRVAPTQKRRVRTRGSAFGHASDGWSCAGRSSANMFWPRYEDICLVAAGVRCAVLLDSRSAPRSSPPLADVLTVLQEHCATDNGAHDCDGGDNGIPCLGLLQLEDSCFLVNRSSLCRRLDELFSEFPSPTNASRTVTSMALRSGVARAPPSSERSLPVPGDGRKSDRVAAAAAIGPRPVKADWSSAGDAARGRKRGRGFVLLDAKRSLDAPTICTDVFAPRLYAALYAVFGGAAASVELPAGAEQPPGTSPVGRSEIRVTITSSNQEARDGDSSKAASEGARWLRRWNTKQFTLDGESLRDSLGGVGLPGLAGWLLEYPVIYCCPSVLEGEKGGDQGRAETEDVGNCLAGAPLTVYSVRVGIGQRASGLPRESCGSFEAFSFSVPVTVRGPIAAAGDYHSACGDVEGRRQAVAAGLHGLVDDFLERIERRVAHHNSRSASCRQQHHSWFHKISVTKRTETLDRVAL